MKKTVIIPTIIFAVILLAISFSKNKTVALVETKTVSVKSDTVPEKRYTLTTFKGKEVVFAKTTTGFYIVTQHQREVVDIEYDITPGPNYNTIRNVYDSKNIGPFGQGSPEKFEEKAPILTGLERMAKPFSLAYGKTKDQALLIFKNEFGQFINMDYDMVHNKVLAPVRPVDDLAQTFWYRKNWADESFNGYVWLVMDTFSGKKEVYFDLASKDDPGNYKGRVWPNDSVNISSSSPFTAYAKPIDAVFGDTDKTGRLIFMRNDGVFFHVDYDMTNKKVLAIATP